MTDHGSTLDRTAEWDAPPGPVPAVPMGSGRPSSGRGLHHFAVALE